MLYRPLFLVLSLLHSSFIAKHLTMNSLPSMRASNRTVFLSLVFFSSSLSRAVSRSFLFRVCMHAFYSLVHRSDGYLTGKRKRISLTFLSIRLSTCRCGGDGVGNHLRSSSLFCSFLPFKGGGGSNAFLFSYSSSICSVSSFSFALCSHSGARAFIRSS